MKAIERLKGTKTPINPHLKDNNKTITEDEEKEDAHRTIWSEVFKISQEDNLFCSRDKDIEVDNFLLRNQNLHTPDNNTDLNRLRGENDIDRLISMREIETTINTFKNNTPGQSKINKVILKHLPENAIKILQNIFNHTLSIGYFPSKFKTAILKLIPKPNSDHSNPINYRPISLLDVTGKTLEKIINKKLRDFLETHNLIPNTLHGFRNHRGTDTAITTKHETIAHHIALKNQCYVVFRDVAKGFDKVWHAE